MEIPTEPGIDWAESRVIMLYWSVLYVRYKRAVEVLQTVVTQDHTPKVNDREGQRGHRSLVEDLKGVDDRRL